MKPLAHLATARAPDGVSGVLLRMPRPVLGMVVATLLWGATFVVVRDCLAALTPAAVVTIRFGAAAVLFALVMLTRRRRLGRWRFGSGQGVF